MPKLPLPLPLPLMGALRVFEAAARLQNMSKAGKELHVSPSAVSRRIKDLERLIGSVLFERVSRKIVLNESGRILFDAVTKGFGHIQRALVDLSGIETIDTLVISVDPEFAALWLLPRLAEFYAIAPHTRVEIRAERVDLAVDDLELSSVIQYAEAGLTVKNGDVLFRSRLFPVCTKDLLQTQPLASVDDLQRHILVHDRTTGEWEEYLARYASTAPSNVKWGFVFNNNALCLDAAARGLGVAIGDDFLAAQYLDEGRLVRPFEASVLSRNAYYLVVPERASRRRSVAAFRRWLLGTVERGKMVRRESEDSGNTGICAVKSQELCGNVT